MEALTLDEDIVDSDPQAQRSTVTVAAGEEERPGQSERPDAERDFRAVLGDDWILLGRCRSGAGEPGNDTGCFVLAHGEIGVALVDLAPGETPNAEARLRRMLNAAGFESAHRGFLPVVHVPVGPAELHGLGAMLDQAFAAELPLDIERGGAWVSTLRGMLRGGVTWESMGRRRASLLRSGRGISRRPSGRSFLPASLVALNLVMTFGLGFFAGILCIPPAAHPGSGIAGGTTPATAPADPLPASLEPSGAIGYGQAQASPPFRPADGLAAPPHPAEPPSPLLAALPSPVTTASAGHVAGLPMTDAELPSGSIEAALPQEVPEARSAAPQHPPRHTGRTSFAIDRRCSDAVFRYQQGASLSWTEMTYIRNGCHSWR